MNKHPSEVKIIRLAEQYAVVWSNRCQNLRHLRSVGCARGRLSPSYRWPHWRRWAARPGPPRSAPGQCSGPGRGERCPPAPAPAPPPAPPPPGSAPPSWWARRRACRPPGCWTRRCPRAASPPRPAGCWPAEPWWPSINKDVLKKSHVNNYWATFTIEKTALSAFKIQMLTAVLRSRNIFRPGTGNK